MSSITAPTPPSSPTGITPAVASGGSWPFEPSGLVAVSERPYTTASEAGWHDQVTSNFSFVQDATAPRSGPSVAQALFPAGFVGGNAPMTSYIDLPASAQAVYLSFWLQLSPNFQGHSSGQNKILFFSLANRFRATFGAVGAGSAPLQPVLELRDVVRSSTVRLVPNVAPGAVVRGQWQRWELVLRANTDANADGTVDVWVDGTRISSYTGIQFVSATDSHAWQSINWAPYWGGSGDVVAADQYMRMDHMYVSAGTPGASSPPPPPTTPSVSAVNVSVPRTSLLVGDTTRLAATAVDSVGSPIAGSTFAWASSDSTVASVDARGLVTARRAGTATVSASSGGRSGSVAISVAQVPVRSVVVSTPVQSLHPTQTAQLTATLTDSANNTLTGRTIAWSSSAPAIATVSPSGLVTAVAPGSVTITATSEGQSGSASLSVTSVPVASISVAANASSLVVGQGTQLVATVRDSAGNVLTGRTISWSSASPAIASVSSAGYVSALAAGSATITATSEGRSAGTTITVTAPVVQPPPASGTNEPSGMTLISDRHFLAFNEAGWTDYRATNFSLVPDATAPQTQATVGQVLYPAGFSGGTEPVNLYVPLGSNRTTLYLAFWFKMSPNFYGHPYSSVNKIFHIWIGGSNRVYLAAMGSGNTATFEPQVRLQGVPTQANYNLGPNLAPATTFVRDRWYKWEVVLHANTPGVADGSVDFWVDGAKVGSYSGVQFVIPGQGNTWESMNWAPTWGGIGGTVPADQWMRMSDIYLSGR